MRGNRLRESLTLKCTEFETFVGYPNGSIQWVVVYVNYIFKREDEA